MSFAVGFFIAALVNLTIGSFGWRWVLLAGATPAVITIFIRRYVPEPDQWVQARMQRALTGVNDTATATFLAIFAPQFRRRTIVGVLISASMMIGSWGVSTLIPTWIHQLLPPDQVAMAGRHTSQIFMLLNVGAILGYLTLVWMTEALGRRWSYFLICAGCAVTNIAMFMLVKSFADLQIAIVVYGFFAVGGFGTFAAYLPELFPTRFRATGQGFCWNMARLMTGAGPLLSGLLVSSSGSLTHSGMMVTWIYAIGLIAIWFGPETKGQPLLD
jgi:MFS family permease